MSRFVVALAALLAAPLAGVAPALSEEWFARTGGCYDWEGRWDVQQEPSGVWVGAIDFVHIGGPCGAATRQYVTNEVRAVIVGGDFFARRTNGAVACYVHGHMRAGEVRGWEQCGGAATPFAFALRFRPPDDNPEPRRR